MFFFFFLLFSLCCKLIFDATHSQVLWKKKKSRYHPTVSAPLCHSQPFHWNTEKPLLQRIKDNILARPRPFSVRSQRPQIHIWCQFQCPQPSHALENNNTSAGMLRVSIQCYLPHEIDWKFNASGPDFCTVKLLPNRRQTAWFAGHTSSTSLLNTRAPPIPSNLVISVQNYCTSRDRTLWHWLIVQTMTRV